MGNGRNRPRIVSTKWKFVNDRTYPQEFDANIHAIKTWYVGRKFHKFNKHYLRISITNTLTAVKDIESECDMNLPRQIRIIQIMHEGMCITNYNKGLAIHRKLCRLRVNEIRKKMQQIPKPNEDAIDVHGGPTAPHADEVDQVEVVRRSPTAQNEPIPDFEFDVPIRTPDQPEVDPVHIPVPTPPVGPVSPESPLPVPPDAPGTPLSVPPDVPGTPLPVPPDVPGTPRPVPPVSPGTPLPVPPDAPGTPLSVPPDVPGTPLSVPPDAPGTLLPVPPVSPGAPPPVPPIDTGAQPTGAQRPSQKRRRQVPRPDRPVEPILNRTLATSERLYGTRIFAQVTIPSTPDDQQRPDLWILRDLEAFHRRLHQIETSIHLNELHDPQDVDIDSRLAPEILRPTIDDVNDVVEPVVSTPTRPPVPPPAFHVPSTTAKPPTQLVPIIEPGMNDTIHEPVTEPEPELEEPVAIDWLTFIRNDANNHPGVYLFSYFAPIYSTTKRDAGIKLRALIELAKYKKVFVQQFEPFAEIYIHFSEEHIILQ